MKIIQMHLMQFYIHPQMPGVLDPNIDGPRNSFKIVNQGYYTDLRQ